MTLSRILEECERFDAPWPMMEIRKRLQHDRPGYELVLCCIPHKCVYATMSISPILDDAFMTLLARRSIISQLADKARERMGWLWWMRTSLAECKAGANEVHSIPTTKARIVCGPNDIGWPESEAWKSEHEADAFQLMLGLGSDSARDWWSFGIDRWTTIEVRDHAQAVAAQAFIANLRSSADRFYRRTGLVDMKKISARLNIGQGPWRAPIYDVVEFLCSARLVGNHEVFHADEEMTWTMFLNRRQP